MLLSLFWTVAGLGGLGGGLWLAALFLPPVALALKAALDVLRSPFGQVVAAMALCVVLYGAGWIAGDLHGAAEVRAAWRAADLKARDAQQAREAAIRATMRAEAERSLATLDVFDQSIDSKVKTHAMQKPADLAVCRRATRDDVRRLLDIR